MLKRGVCCLCGARHKKNGQPKGGVIRVDSRFRPFSVVKRRLKYLREKEDAQSSTTGVEKL